MNFAPFTELLIGLIGFYKTLVIVWIIISLLISFNIVNSYQPIVSRVMATLDRLIEPVLSRIRKFLPNLPGIDISPIILFFLLDFIINSIKVYL